MEIVQTSTGTWPWCMSMIGARFAVFVRRARVLPGRFASDYICSFPAKMLVPGKKTSPAAPFGK